MSSGWSPTGTWRKEHEENVRNAEIEPHRISATNVQKEEQFVCGYLGDSRQVDQGEVQNVRGEYLQMDGFWADTLHVHIQYPEHLKEKEKMKKDNHHKKKKKKSDFFKSILLIQYYKIKDIWMNINSINKKKMY